jgi:cytochrome P450
MSRITKCSMTTRLSGKLPPSPRHPATLQTIGGRRWPYAYLEHCLATCGDPFTLYPLDMPPMVLLSDPQNIREVLTGSASDLHPGAGGHVIAPLIGDRSFMLLEEDDHAWGRKTITPAFHRRMVAEQTATLTVLAEKAVASWSTGSPIALHPRIRALTLDIILRVIFSDKLDSQLARLQERLTRVLAITDSLLLQGPKLRHVPGWSRIWRRFLTERAEVDVLIHQLVGERREATNNGEHGDLLDMLLAAERPDGTPMSPAEIRDNLMSMILAGHETTTGELAWAFQLLAHNPLAQARLRDDLDRGSEAYLTATVHETMRHRPVFVFTIPRAVAAPVQIGEWNYPPQVQLAACTYLLHHRPDLYPNPHSFRPERFIGAAAQSRTWLPWGGGAKHCLGRHFAMLEVQAILRHVVTCRLVLPASARIERPRWRSAILVPAHGGRVVLEPLRTLSAPSVRPRTFLIRGRTILPQDGPDSKKVV